VAADPPEAFALTKRVSALELAFMAEDRRVASAAGRLGAALGEEPAAAAAVPAALQTGAGGAAKIAARQQRKAGEEPQERHTERLAAQLEALEDAFVAEDRRVAAAAGRLAHLLGEVAPAALAALASPPALAAAQAAKPAKAVSFKAAPVAAAHAAAAPVAAAGGGDKAAVLAAVGAAVAAAVDEAPRGEANAAPLGLVLSRVPGFKALNIKLNVLLRTGAVPGFVWTQVGIGHCLVKRASPGAAAVPAAFKGNGKGKGGSKPTASSAVSGKGVASHGKAKPKPPVVAAAPVAATAPTLDRASFFF
jgi:hypothetical protein